MPERSVVVTFDDGYENNYLTAYPLLKKYGIPATFFIATAFIESGEMLWFDRLASAFASTKAERWESPLGSGSWPLRSEADRAECYLRTKGQLKSLPDARRRELLEKVCRALAGAQRLETPALFAPMKNDQIREMASSGLIEIGSHSQRHPILTSLPSEDARDEIAASKKRTAEISGREADSFSYPNGAVSPELMRLVEGAGYSCAVAVGLRLNPPAGVSPYAIARVALAEGDTVPLIAATLCGIREKFIR
jgi:peptidoglycan/xylan/chitin deacetylase (PgdA/CDA1 family)